MYRIVNLGPFGYETLATFDTYSEADLVYDDYAERYSEGWIEIISEADYVSTTPND